MRDLTPVVLAASAKNDVPLTPEPQSMGSSLQKVHVYF